MSAQTELPQASTESTGSCCSPSGSCHSGDAAETPQGATTTVYEVTGMTCGHCEGAVSSEISEIAGVSSVTAVAATGLVTVVSDAPLDEEAVRAAVDEAGYELAGVSKS
ncbi:heavy-metal-associated domain-containing protein [Actinomycetota bacterium Odt1-20B]